MAYEILTEDSADSEVGVLKITREYVNLSYDFIPAVDIEEARRIYMARCETNTDPNRITYVLVKVR